MQDWQLRVEVTQPHNKFRAAHPRHQTVSDHQIEGLGGVAGEIKGGEAIKSLDYGPFLPQNRRNANTRQEQSNALGSSQGK